MSVQWIPRGLRLILRHAKHLLLVTFCDIPAGIDKKLKEKDKRTEMRTDRHEVGNIYLDSSIFLLSCIIIGLSYISRKGPETVRSLSAGRGA